MKKIEAIDANQYVFDIYRDLSVLARRTRPGPPERIDGVTVGFVTMTQNAPHGGEVHPDGDEILYVVSGRLRITCDSLDEGIVLEPGHACIVPKGEWHQVQVLEPTQLVHVTPGPNGAHRPLS